MSWLLWCWITLLRVPWTIRRFKSINPNGKWTWKLLSSVWVFVTPWTIYTPWNSLGLNTGVGSHSLLQEIFPNQGSNLLAHCRQILYQAEPQGKPKNTGVGSLSLLQQIFLTQKSNQGLLHCRQILYQLSHQGSRKSGLVKIKVTWYFTRWSWKIKETRCRGQFLQETSEYQKWHKFSNNNL